MSIPSLALPRLARSIKPRAAFPLKPAASLIRPRVSPASIGRGYVVDATRPEIDTPPSLYQLTEDEEMLRDAGE